MISKIINKAKQFQESLRLLQRRQEDDMALSQLLKMFDNGIFIPLTGWSISPREVLHICNDIAINDRKSIVEFGSGFSTICIARLLKITGRRASFISVENNADWAAEFESILKKMELDSYVRIVQAPIGDLPAEFALRGQAKWYDVNVLSSVFSGLESVDQVIVDGPYGQTTPFARYSAVPFLKNKLSGRYGIFLDDSQRKDESIIASEWSRILKGRSKSYTRYTYFTNDTAFDVTPFS